MIKLILKINEENKKCYEEIIATKVDVQVEEIGIKATKSEKETSKILRERIGLKDNIQFINKSERKEKVNELLRELFSI